MIEPLKISFSKPKPLLIVECCVKAIFKFNKQFPLLLTYKLKLLSPKSHLMVIYNKNTTKILSICQIFRLIIYNFSLKRFKVVRN